MILRHQRSRAAGYMNEEHRGLRPQVKDEKLGVTYFTDIFKGIRLDELTSGVSVVAERTESHQRRQNGLKRQRIILAMLKVECRKKAPGKNAKLKSTLPYCFRCPRQGRGSITKVTSSSECPLTTSDREMEGEQNMSAEKGLLEVHQEKLILGI